MEHLKVKREELNYKIWELESQSKDLLNFENVPDENWELARVALSERKEKLEVLKHINEVIKLITFKKIDKHRLITVS